MSGGDTQQGPPPPPQPSRPSGSPFGRFLTSPVLLVGVVALVVGFATFRYVGDDGGGTGASAPMPTPGASLEGTWRGGATAGVREIRIRLELRDDGTGTLRRAGCAGTLTPAPTMGGAAVFDYEAASRERGCPRRTQVSVTQVDPETLRLEERLPDGRTLLEGTLRRR